MKILVIEDDALLLQGLILAMQSEGYVCDGVSTAHEAALSLASNHYSLIVLDLGLPDGDGVAWLANRRQYRQMPPAIIQTARGALEDRVTGLDAGADDYVVKPVEIDELAARIRALLRRPGPRVQPVLEAGCLRFDTAARTAHCGDYAIDLSRREADLLELLLRRAGTVVRRETIEDALYNFNEPVTPNAVEAAVSRLRRKLDEAGATGALHTIRGVGYMLKDVAA